MATSANAITPPPGYTLETPPAQQPQGITPPLGYTLEQPQPQGITPEEGQYPGVGAPHNAIATGVKEAGEDIWDTLKGAVAHPMQTAEGVASGAMGPVTGLHTSVQQSIGAYHAYEKARQSGKGIIDSLQAASDQMQAQDATAQMLQKRADEFKKQPGAATVHALANAAVLAATMYGGGEVAGGLADVGEAEAPEVAAGAATAKTPVEAAVERGVGKSGLTTGAPATTAPAEQSIQPQMQAGIRNAISDIANKAGVGTPTTKSIRGIIEETADKVEAQSKAIYRTIDTATDGRFQPNADALKNVNLKLRDITGLDDEKEAELIAKKQRLEWQQDQMFDEAVKKGVPKQAIDAAKARFKQAQALYDTDAQLKASMSGRAGVGKGVETVDPKKLVPRLHKLYDSGRLQEAGGEDSAKALIEHAENGQDALQQIKDFVPSSPTGKNALQEILTKNTEGKASLIGRGKITGKTNWNGAVKDFENLTSAQQTQMFGNDVGRVRQFLGKQALRQNAMTALKIAGGTAVTGGLGAVGYEAVTH